MSAEVNPRLVQPPRLVVLMELEEATRSTRRDMLKKLAVTSAAAGLTATVVSSRAFADSGTVNSRPVNTDLVTVTIAEVSSSNSTLVARATPTFPTGLNAITCPFGANPPKVEYVWQLAGTSGDAVQLTTGTSFTTTLADATVTGTGGGNSAFDATFTLTLTIRWACNQRPPYTPTVAWVCQSFAVSLTHNNNGTTSGFGAMADAAQSTICNATTPTLP